MKSHSKYLLLFLLLPFMTACKDLFDDIFHDKTTVYQEDIATVKNPTLSSKFFFVLDNNRIMQITETDLPSFMPTDGQRIIANYVLLSKSTADTTNIPVKLVDVYTVLTKGIFKIKPANQDSIGHDSITIRDMWIGNDYLNIEFAYKGYNKTHYINLVSDASKVYTDGKIHLEFRHNGNGDSPMYNYKGIVSFNLKSLQTGVTGNSLNLVIHVKAPFKTVEQTYGLNYVFGPTASTNVYYGVQLNELMKEAHSIH